MIIDNEKFYTTPQMIIRKLLGIKNKKDKFIRRYFMEEKWKSYIIY